MGYSDLSSPCLHYTLSISAHDEPSTYRQDIKHSQWIAAMKSELEALKLNDTWIITNLPLGKTPIGCKWVFKIKYNADGSIERHKTRLAAKGFT